MLLILVTLLSGCCPWCGRKEYNEAKAKMAELCAKDGGLHVYERVVLPKGQKFKDDGYPPMHDFGHGEKKAEDFLGPDYREIEKRDELYFGDPKIRLIGQTILVIRRLDEKTVGKTTRFELSDGYAIEGTGNGTKTHCPIDGLDSKKLYLKIFIESN